MKELPSDWKGKIMFPCHVVYDCASVTKSTLRSDPPPVVDICDYIGGQVYNAKRSLLPIIHHQQQRVTGCHPMLIFVWAGLNYVMNSWWPMIVILITYNK